MAATANMKFFVHVQNANHGPYTREQLAEWRDSGRVKADTPCIGEGETDWSTVGALLGPPEVEAELPPVIAPAAGAFHKLQYVAKRNWSESIATGCMFHVFDPREQGVLFVKQDLDDWKTVFHFCTDAGLQNSVIEVRAQQVVTFGGEYVVVADGAHLGTLRREGMKSVMRDEWTFLNPAGQELGTLLEDSGGEALLRRFNTAARVLMVQKYHGTINNQPVCFMERDINPYASKITLDFTMDSGRLLDRRLGIALGVMMLAIEGK